MKTLAGVLRLGAHRVGNKAYRLAVMAKLNLAVKPAVVIEVEEVSALQNTQNVPQAITTFIYKHLRESPVGWAVRSSGIGEDSSAHSWAGQFLTVLNVQSAELAQAIVDCANAVNSPSVRSYAAQHHLEIPRLSIIVQEMVDAESSGVHFTSCDFGVKANTAMIEAVKGLGEKLVSGTSTPASWTLDRYTGEILAQRSSEEGSILSHSQLKAIMLSGWKLQEHFGAEQDIEWAVAKDTGTLYLNQSRDITALQGTSRYSEQAVKDYSLDQVQAFYQEVEWPRLETMGFAQKSDVLSNQNIAELLTRHPCQMAFGLFTYCFAHGNGAIRQARNEMGYELGPEVDQGFFVQVTGQPRCSIVHDALTYRLKGIPMTDYQRIVVGYLQKIEEDIGLANYPEILLYEQDPTPEFLAQYFEPKTVDRYMEVYATFRSNLVKLEEEFSHYCHTEFIPEWQKLMERYRATNVPETVPELVAEYTELVELLRSKICPNFVKAARLGFYAYARLVRLITHLKKCGRKEADEWVGDITNGIPADQNPNLLFSVELDQMRTGKKKLEEIVSEYGHLGPHELEISVPRYADKPNCLQIMAEGVGAEVQQKEKLCAKSNALVAELVNTCGVECPELNREIQVARTYLPLREVLKFEYLKVYARLRQIAVALGEKLGFKENLIFHLDPREVMNLAEVDFLAGLAKNRSTLKKIYEQIKGLPDAFPLTEKGVITISSAVTTDGSNLRGISVTKTTMEGIVVVVHDPFDREVISLLKPGVVLVTQTTDPAWSPFLAKISPGGGLITEVGGALAHGAIYAREMGIAAVLAVPNVTQILKTGMRVRVNDPSGTVVILPP